MGIIVFFFGFCLFVFSQPPAALSQWRLCKEVARALGSWVPWQCQIPRGASSNCHRKYGAIRVFTASGSSALVRIEHGGVRVTWIVRGLVVPNVQVHALPQLWSY